MMWAAAGVIAVLIHAPAQAYPEDAGELNIDSLLWHPVFADIENHDTTDVIAGLLLYTLPDTISAGYVWHSASVYSWILMSNHPHEGGCHSRRMKAINWLWKLYHEIDIAANIAEGDPIVLHDTVADKSIADYDPIITTTREEVQAAHRSRVVNFPEHYVRTKSVEMAALNEHIRMWGALVASIGLDSVRASGFSPLPVRYSFVASERP